MSDLEEYLQRVDTKLQKLLLRDVDHEANVEQRSLQNEKDCIQKCLDICNEVSSHIDSVRPQVLQSSSTFQGDTEVFVSTSRAVTKQTDQALVRCKDDLNITLFELKKSLEEVDRRQQALSQPHDTFHDQDTEQKKLQEEIESIKKSLEICTEASKQVLSDRTNVFEDVSMADDGHQVLVSTFGDLISAKKISAGARSRQWLGQMSDESLQQLSRVRDEADSKPKVGREQPSQFEVIHGQGRSLSHLRK